MEAPPYHPPLSIIRWISQQRVAPSGTFMHLLHRANDSRFFAKAMPKKQLRSRSGWHPPQRPATVQAFEKQRVKPRFKTVQALAKAFGVGLETLAG